jgi:hypothetical protein
MGIAALICWLVTAFGGLYLLAVWLIENDVTDEGGTASRLYGPVVLGHVLLALTGLVVWVLYLISDSDTMGWAALAILGGIATLGLTMFARWIPVRASFVAAEAGVGVSAEFDFPAERAFPVSVVAGHGLFAVTTFTLVLLTVLGVGGS